MKLDENRNETQEKRNMYKYGSKLYKYLSRNLVHSYDWIIKIWRANCKHRFHGKVYDFEYKKELKL